MKSPLRLTSRAIIVDDPRRDARFAHDRATGRQWALGDTAMRVMYEASTGDGFRPRLRPMFAAQQTVVKAMRAAGMLARSSSSTAGTFRRPTTMLSRVFAEITAQCNLRCAHCYGDFNIQRRERLSLEQIEVLASEAARIGVYEFDLTGGEALLHPDFPEILEILEANGMLTTVFTNLTHVPPRVRDSITARGVTKLITSIESVDPRTHDSFRGLEGAHRRTLKYAQVFKDGGIRVIVNVVAGQHNVATVPQTVEFLTRRGLAVTVDLISECGRALAGSGVTGTQAVALRADLLRLPAYRERRSEGCGVGSRLLFVTASGDLTLCPSLRAGPFRVGTIHAPFDLGSVARRVASVGDIRCATMCPVIDICAGGCRAEALRLRGSLTAPDPSRCEYYGVL